MINVLLITDKFVIAKSIEKRLSRIGYHISGSVSRLDEAVRTLSENIFDVVLLDLDLKGENNLFGWVRKIKARFNTPFVYLTRYLTKDLIEKDQDLTVLNTVQEPYEARDLQKTIELVRIQSKQEQEDHLKIDDQIISFLKRLPEVIIICSQQNVVFINDIGNRFLGLGKKHNLIGKDIKTILSPDCNEREFLHKGKINSQKVVELKFTKPDGEIVDVEVSMIPIHFKGKKSVLLFVRNINKRKRFEQKLKLVNNALQSSLNGVLIADAHDKITTVNPAFLGLFGYKKDEDIVGEKTQAFFKEKQIQKMEDIHESADSIEEVDEYRATFKDGFIYFYEVSSSVIMDEQDHIAGKIYSFNNITKRKQAEQKLKDLIREKELLLKEIHHRVKNNFQIIISLLNLKLQHINEGKVQELFRESRDRIRSMAMIHEHLYKTDDFKEIHFGDYIQNLLSELKKSYRIEPDKISFELTIEDITLDLDRAIPCGLIITELISNSLKHAFPQNRAGKGRILISLLRKKNEIELTFQDNGVGVLKSFNMKETKSLGLHLIDMLVTDQLQGSIRMDRNRGLKFIITFRLPDQSSKINQENKR